MPAKHKHHVVLCAFCGSFCSALCFSLPLEVDYIHLSDRGNEVWVTRRSAPRHTHTHPLAHSHGVQLNLQFSLGMSAATPTSRSRRRAPEFCNLNIMSDLTCTPGHTGALQLHPPTSQLFRRPPQKTQPNPKLWTSPIFIVRASNVAPTPDETSTSTKEASQYPAR